MGLIKFFLIAPLFLVWLGGLVACVGYIAYGIFLLGSWQIQGLIMILLGIGAGFLTWLVHAVMGWLDHNLP